MPFTQPIITFKTGNISNSINTVPERMFRPRCPRCNAMCKPTVARAGVAVDLPVWECPECRIGILSYAASYVKLMYESTTQRVSLQTYEEAARRNLVERCPQPNMSDIVAKFTDWQARHSTQ